MTYNVFGGTLNLALSIYLTASSVCGTHNNNKKKIYNSHIVMNHESGGALPNHVVTVPSGNSFKKCLDDHLAETDKS